FRRSARATGSRSDRMSAALSGPFRSNCPRMGAESRLLSSQVHLNLCQRAPKVARLLSGRIRTRLMKLNTKILPPIALVGALALVPVTASYFAAADTTNYQELEK